MPKLRVNVIVSIPRAGEFLVSQVLGRDAATLAAWMLDDICELILDEALGRVQVRFAPNERARLRKVLAKARK